MKYYLLTAICLLGFSGSLLSQDFTEVVDADFEGVQQSVIQIGDYNNDGLLDLLSSGWINTAGSAIGTTNIYRNNGSFDFSNSFNAESDSVYESIGVWADFDNNGFLDFFVSGNENGSYSANMYMADGSGGFELNTSMSFDALATGYAVAADVDNDGDQDLIYSGFYITGARRTLYYRNNGDLTFTLDESIFGLDRGNIALGDYDNDGDSDLLICGDDGSDTPFTYLYDNNNGVFENSEKSLQGVFNADIQWIDYDMDSDLDIVLSGYDGTDGFSGIYENQDGEFVLDETISLEGLFNSEIAVGDINNDGYPDLVMTGFESIFNIYINQDGAGFTELDGHGISGMYDGDIALADLDNDNDLDLVMTGYFSQGEIKTFRNDIATQNTAPSSPGNISLEVGETGFTISWDLGTDAESPDTALYYNAWLTFQGDTILYSNTSSNANLKVPGFGNLQNANSVSFDRKPGDYEFAIQTIDQSYVTSDFSDKLQFHINYIPEISAIDLQEFNEDDTLAIDLNDLEVFDEDNNFPADFSYSLTAGENFTVVNDTLIVPSLNFYGEISTSIIISDGTDNSEPFEFDITVHPVNDLPTIEEISIQTNLNEDDTLFVTIDDITVTDPDNVYPSEFKVLIGEGSNYSVVIDSFLIPSQDYFGTLNASVSVVDSDGGVSEAVEFTLIVDPVNDIPEILEVDELSMDEDDTLMFALDLLTVSDPDNTFPDEFSFVVLEGTNYSVRNNQEIIPTTDFDGALTASVTVSDGEATSEIFEFEIEVIAINDAPVITAYDGETAGIINTAFELDILDFTVTDVDNSFPDDHTLTLLEGADYTIDGNNLIPTTDFEGQITVSVEISDGDLISDAFGFEIIFERPTSVTSLLKQAKVGPNPTSGRLIINSELAIQGVQILNLRGELVKEWDTIDGDINLEEFEAGVYILQITASENKIITKKIIIE